MIRFRTEVELPSTLQQANYRRPFLMVGSCFTENIGGRLKDLCFPVEINPFGVLYNPASIADCIETILDKKVITEDELFFHNGLWSCFRLHGSFSSATKEELLAKINPAIVDNCHHISQLSHLFVTFGTSWVYALKEDDTIAANCHKLPANRFNRYRLEVSDIVSRWKLLIEKLVNINPTIQIVFTVSPIRHLKDGAFENQVSKSTLFLAIAEVLRYFGTDRLCYFPSYELVMDELRDYRFYAADMNHPSETAIGFIGEKFDSVFIDTESQGIAKKIAAILRGIEHKPFRAQEQSYRNFIDNLTIEAVGLTSAYPFVNINTIIKRLDSKRLNNIFT